MTVFNLKEFQARRNQLLANMGEGIAIIPTAPEAIRNRDSHYPYRFDSYFYYLTGFTEPESVLVFIILIYLQQLWEVSQQNLHHYCAKRLTIMPLQPSIIRAFGMTLERQSG